MMERFICLDCSMVGELTRHMRCSTCGSDAVASTNAHIPQAFPINQFDEIRELERIAQLL